MNELERELKKKNKKLIEVRWFTKDIKTYDFREFKTIRAFGHDITTDIIDIPMENDEQNKLILT